MTKSKENSPNWADLAAMEVLEKLHDYIPLHLDYLHAVKVIAQAIREQPGRPPDYCYDFEGEWEMTYPWRDSDHLVDDLDIGKIMAIATLMAGPTKYAAHVTLTTDSAGDPDKTEIQWFDSEKAAQEAVKAKPAGDAT